MSIVTDELSQNHIAQINAHDTESLNNFLEQWDLDYAKSINNIPLFNPELTKLWTQQQKVRFIKVFYHSRGHFRDFLWHLGNFAPNKAAKALVLENIAEEFGGDNPSHEQLYLDFAQKHGVDLTKEILEEKNYITTM